MDYKKDYEEFLNKYNAGTEDAEGVGAQIARFAQHYCTANSIYSRALNAYNLMAKAIEITVDDANGKPISSAKAKILSSATEESEKLILAKADVENIEQCINALKSLQKGIMREMQHTGNM